MAFSVCKDLKTLDSPQVKCESCLLSPRDIETGFKKQKLRPREELNTFCMAPTRPLHRVFIHP